jgi:hypothetical protein
MRRTGKGLGPCDTPALVADQDRRVGVIPWRQYQERFLEARVESGHVGEVRAVLAVSKEDKSVVSARAGCRS